jgi:hypothetical protein
VIATLSGQRSRWAVQLQRSTSRKLLSGVGIGLVKHSPSKWSVTGPE